VLSRSELPGGSRINRAHNLKLEALFDAAIELSSAERAAFLERECASDAGLRRELEALLAAAPPLRRSPSTTLLLCPEPDALDTVVTPGDVATAPIHGDGVVFRPGMSIYQYELIRELGSGGMGRVYLARDTKLARRVAIKFLQCPDISLSERFLREAQATARCSHENIVVIHDVKEHDRVPFMVLEYLKGQTLGALIGDGKLPPSRAVQLMVPVVRALVCAHQHEIVHRDLKPANIFITEAGTIKVLDFGVAKVVGGAHGPVNALDSTAGGTAGSLLPVALTLHGVLVGTVPYMSPEQWGADIVDHRTDLWAVGIMLYRMVVGRHPLAPLDGRQLRVTAVLEQPMPSAHDASADMPPELADVIDACLKKRKAERIPSAEQLLDALAPLLPGQRPVELHGGGNPYTGLNAFQEADASRFFGRTREVGAVMTKLDGMPIIGVVGPSGVGKSSFVRAGVIPALKQSGDPWEALVIRPGRQPMAALANILVPMLGTGNTELTAQVAEHQSTLQRLYQEPGYLGTLLRSRARTQGCKILLFVDQFEELFTLNRETSERRAFTACLTGMADDPLSPLRLMLSIRSDFLDRMIDDQLLMNELGPGMFFLAPPDREGLREAIVRPLEMARHRFEAPAIVEHMLDTLQATPGCLPLLQFAASKLWEARDRERRVLTEHSYGQLGGVAGALATHADAVLAGMSSAQRSLARAVFERLVTPERTRALVATDELRALHHDAGAVDDIVQHLGTMRLLVIERGADGAGYTVELVHESLIDRWPVLARWLDEKTQDDAAFLRELCTASIQWEAHGRAAGLLWRFHLLDDARRWLRRYRGPLPPLQKEFLDAAFAQEAVRATRIKRAAVAVAILGLCVLFVIVAVSIVAVREAREEATQQALIARAAEQRASEQAAAAREAEKLALDANQQIREQLDIVREHEAARRVALARANTSEGRALKSEEGLAHTNEALKMALARAEVARKIAEELLAQERKRRERAERGLTGAIRRSALK
jgi:serine/threonine protein kinase